MESSNEFMNDLMREDEVRYFQFLYRGKNFDDDSSDDSENTEKENKDSSDDK